MGCQKLTYQTTEPLLKVVYRAEEPDKKSVQRFLSVDPLSVDYPFNSPYAFAENDVVRSIDLEGLEKYVIHNFYQNGELSRTKISMVRDANGELVNMRLVDKDGQRVAEKEVLIIRMHADNPTKIEL